MLLQRLTRVFTFSLLFACSAFSQGERGTITGTVSDVSGGIINGANVTLRNVATNIRTTVTANASGLYVFPALSPGTYDISFEQQGFKTKKISNVPLATGTTVTIDTQLEVGSVSESVQVEASAVQLELQTSGLSKVVEARKCWNFRCSGAIR